MSLLFDKIKANKQLVIVDAEIGEKNRLKDILFDLSEIDSGKQLVFLYVSNSVYDVGIYFSLFSVQHLVVLLNVNLHIDFKKKLEADYQPDIVYDPSRNLISDYGAKEFHSINGTIQLHLLKKKIGRKFNHKIKVLLSTSGTTGSPKFVKLSETNLLANTESIVDYLPIVSEDVTPLNLPIFYSYGLSVLHTNAINGGQIICNVPDILQRKFWKQFEQFGFTSIAGVPYVYEMLNRIGFRKKAYPSLKYFHQAGGNLNVEMKKLYQEYAKENQVEFYVMYGQTEATARISFVEPKMLDQKISSIGKEIKNGIFSLDNETGELCYTGPNVFGGYASNVSDLANWEQIDVLKTGDLAKKDADEYYYITGRLKRFVKIFGNRINLDDLESLLKNKFTGTPFACTNYHDKAVIISVIDEVDDKLIKQFLQDKLKIHPSVIKIQYVADFPLSNNGKLNYSKLVEVYES